VVKLSKRRDVEGVGVGTVAWGGVGKRKSSQYT